MEKYDVAIIGAGPGGYVAAISSARYGLKTILIEKEEAGGLCLNWGCIPSKILLHHALFHRKIKKMYRDGIYDPPVPVPNFDTIIKYSSNRVKDIRSGLEELILNSGVTLLYGKASLESSNSIQIIHEKAEMRISASNIIIATGATPQKPTFLPTHDARIITSREALSLERLPKNLCIMGGGAIGCEMASFFSAFGTAVTIIELMPRLLPEIDPAISDCLKRKFEEYGIVLKLSSKINNVTHFEGDLKIKFTGPNETKMETSDYLLIATGIAPAEFMDFRKIGGNIGPQGFILADRQTYKTNIPNIYAIGDTIEFSDKIMHPALAHVASAEGEIVAEIIAKGSASWNIDYKNIPIAIFTDPEIGSAGLTEEEAEKRCPGRIHTQIVRDSWLGVGLALDGTGFTKIITDTRTDAILGAHIVGYAAAERIHQFTIAQRAEETIQTMSRQIMAHPTFSESVRELLLALDGRAVHVPTAFQKERKK